MLTIIITVIALALILTFLHSKLTPTPRNNLIMFVIGSVAGASIMLLIAYTMKFSSVPIAVLYAVLGGLCFGCWLGYKPKILKAIRKA